MNTSTQVGFGQIKLVPALWPELAGLIAQDRAIEPILLDARAYRRQRLRSHAPMNWRRYEVLMRRINEIVDFCRDRRPGSVIGTRDARDRLMRTLIHELGV